MSVETRADELVATLTAAGLSATSDPSKVDALFKQDKGTAVVLVEPMPTFADAMLCGDWKWTWRFIALAPRAGSKIPATRLVAAVEKVVDALPVFQAVPSTYALEEGQAPYPAYIMTMED